MIRIIYSLVFTLLLPLILTKVAWRNLRDKKGDRKSGPKLRIMERFGLRAPSLGQPHRKGGIIFHVVSVGEAIAASNLIREFHSANPELPICITCTTPTGSNLIQSKLGDIASHCYLPFDIPIFLHLFFVRMKPKAVFILETEIWPNLNYQCNRKNIALVLINARLSKKSMLGYRKIKMLAKPAINRFTQVLCQSEADASNFRALGLPDEKSQIMGNLKFDIHADKSLNENASRVHTNVLMGRTCWIAASTHPGEDEPILIAHKKLQESLPNLVLILVPRHPQRADELSRLCRNHSLNFVLRTEEKPLKENDQVFILDTIGELMCFYAMSEVCFIGGSLIEHGGHNPLEPALLKKPVVSGPHVHNFKKVFEDLHTEDAVMTVRNSEQLSKSIQQLIENKEDAERLGDRAFDYLNKHRGATKKALVVLNETVAD